MRGHLHPSPLKSVIPRVRFAGRRELARATTKLAEDPIGYSDEFCDTSAHSRIHKVETLLEPYILFVSGCLNPDLKYYVWPTFWGMLYEIFSLDGVSFLV